MDPRTIHEITRGEIEHIVECLGFIEKVRVALEIQGHGNERLASELQASAGVIYEIVTTLPEGGSGRL